MALGLLDGAEHRIPRPPFMDTVTSDAPIYVTPGRYGTGVMLRPGNNNTYNWRIQTAADPEIWFGMAFIQQSALVNGGNPMMQVFGDGTTARHLSLYMASDGSLNLYRGDSGTGVLLDTSAAASITVDIWHYIELYALIDNATGAYEVRVDGVNVMSGSGVDTRNGGTDANVTVCGTVKPGGNVYEVDDVYIVTGDGTGASGFQGEISIEGIKPNGAGNYTQLTPTGSATNWQNVDEVPFSTSDYNGSPTPGQKDTYTLENLIATTGDILGTVLHMGVNKNLAGFIKGRRVIRIGGVDYNGADTPVLSATMRPFSELIEVSPATSTAWTISEVNGTEAGFEVRSA